MAIEYADELTGPNIYQLENKTVYFNKFKKTAYIITDKDVKQYVKSSRRFWVSLLVTFVGIVFFQLVVESLILGLAVYLLVTYHFYNDYLKKLNRMADFSEEKYYDYRAYTPNVTRKILIVMLLVSLVLLYVEYLICK